MVYCRRIWSSLEMEEKTICKYAIWWWCWCWCLYEILIKYQIWYSRLFLHNNTLTVSSRIIWCVFFLARWLSALTTACLLITWTWLCSWWRRAIRCMRRWRRAWVQRSLTLTCSTKADGTSMWRFINLYNHLSFLTINSLGGWRQGLKLLMQVLEQNHNAFSLLLSINKMVIDPQTVQRLCWVQIV